MIDEKTTEAAAPADDLLDGFDAAIASDVPQDDAPAEAAAEAPAEAAGEGAVAEADEAPAAEKPKAETPDQVEAEISSLGLKEKSAARFRELTAEVKELAPLREQLKAAGIEKVEDLPRIAQRARDADELISMVQETGATPDQYGMALDYLRLVNAGQRGDVKAVEQAYEIMSREVAALGQLLGKEIPGIHDPLAQHSDLQQAVEAGDMTRKYALEVAASRTQQHVRSRADEQVQQQTRQQQAVERGRQGLIQFDQHAAASDPAYAAKRPILNGIVATIRETLPPEQWLAATQRAYAAIQLPAAPVTAPAPKPTPGPVRASGPRPAMIPQTDDPMEALEFALQQQRA